MQLRWDEREVRDLWLRTERVREVGAGVRRAARMTLRNVRAKERTKAADMMQRKRHEPRIRF